MAQLGSEKSENIDISGYSPYLFYIICLEKMKLKWLQSG